MNKRSLNQLLMVVLTMCALGFASCGDDSIGNGDDGGGQIELNKEFAVSGKVEKGPFVSGSTITMQPLNRKIKSVGSMYTATITDNDGSFAFKSEKFSEPYARLQVNGYFFNEYTGELSKGPITLTGAAKLADQQSVNVNILTHLKYQRVMNLAESGEMTFEEANDQAQKELLTAFGLQRYVGTDVSRFSIAAGTDESAALVAVSAMLLCDKSEAQFTEYLQALCQDFGSNGKFSDTHKAQMKTDREELRSQLKFISRFVIERYKDLGREITLKNLAEFFDWDEDGIAGNEIFDEKEPIELSQTHILVPNSGGEYVIDIKSPIRLLLGEDTWEDDDILNSILGVGSLINDQPIEKELKDNKLYIKVKGNSLSHVYYINICDLGGQPCANIALYQIRKSDNGQQTTMQKYGNDLTSLLRHYINETIISGVGKKDETTWNRYYDILYKLIECRRIWNIDMPNLDLLITKQYVDLINVFGAIPQEISPIQSTDTQLVRQELIRIIKKQMESAKGIVKDRLACTLGYIYWSMEKFQEASDFLHQYLYPSGVNYKNAFDNLSVEAFDNDYMMMMDWEFSINDFIEGGTGANVKDPNPIWLMMSSDYYLGMLDDYIDHPYMGSFALSAFSGQFDYADGAIHLQTLRRHCMPSMKSNPDVLLRLYRQYKEKLDSKVDEIWFSDILKSFLEYDELFRDWGNVPLPWVN